MVQTLNHCKSQGQLSISQRRAIISLLHKKGKPETNIKNWRPISLLNNDYKIMTKTLAKRMEKVIGSLVHSNQSGFVKGCFIGEGVRFVNDLIEYMDNYNKCGLALQLDFEKAFDSVEWKFLITVLQQFGFGPNFIQWVKICYTDLFSTVGNAGHTTGWFRILRGVRQGCPLSCLLFILVVEILAIKIHDSEHIKGIKIGDREHKIFQFADDTTCLLRDEDSVEYLFDTVKEFTKYSGLRLNINKTILIWLGPWRTKTINRNNLRVETGSFNMLGIHIGRCKQTSDKKNFDDKRNKMIKQFNIWSSRNMTLIGKILITKTYGISNLIYSLTMSDINKKDIIKTQMEINKYLWNNRTTKVKHTTLIGEIQQGGLKMVDVEVMNMSLRLAWLSRLLDQNDWNNIANLYLKQYGGVLFLLRCNVSSKLLELPIFYRKIFDFISLIVKNDNAINIIWNNKDVLINNKPIFYKGWMKKGIIYIQDLCKPDGNWFSYHEFCKKYGLTNCFLKYNGIIHNFKHLFRTSSKYTDINLKTRPSINFENTCFITIDNDTRIDIRKAKSKTYHELFIKSKYVEPSALRHWREEDKEFTDNTLYQSFEYAKQSTRDTRLLTFNFKLMHRIINNNSNLTKWNMKSNPCCTFCSDHEIDDTKHALINCTWTYQKLALILDSLDPDRDWGRTVNTKTWIFGVANPSVNLLLLIIKKYLCDVRSGLYSFSIHKLQREIYMRILSDKKFMNPIDFETKLFTHATLVNESVQYGVINGMNV